MRALLTDWLQVISALGALLSGLGLFGVMGSVFLLLRQTRIMEAANRAATYQSLIATGSSVNMIMFEHPELLDALHDEPDLENSFPPPTEQERRTLLLATQMLDYFELVLVTVDMFPPPLQEEWRDYIRTQLRRLPYLRAVVLMTDWYTAELRALAVAAR